MAALSKFELNNNFKFYFIISLILLTFSCKKTEKTSTTKNTDLTGTYISSAMIPDVFGGTWINKQLQFTINNNKSYIFKIDTIVQDEGNYYQNNDIILLKSFSNYNCFGMDATYRYTTDCNKLMFITIGDTCNSRYLLSKVNWTKKY